jgi:pimeloyl-ACP methyl ester carboxylesterase
MKSNSLIFRLFLILLLTAWVFPSLAASKSDRAKEKRWEEQIVDSLLVGEAVKLKAGDTMFLALYAEPATDQSKGAVILLHGIGAHPAWPDVIDPLRMQLPEHGWYTLSLQMPILANGKKDSDYSPLFPEVPARIQAGVDFLKSRGITNIVLAGHSLGAAMASYYLSTLPDQAVKTFVILSGGSGVPGDKRMDSLANFKQIHNMNIVDVFGSEDREQIFKQLLSRKAVAREAHKGHYKILQIKGANHFYRGRQTVLVEELNTRLTQDMKVGLH